MTRIPSWIAWWCVGACLMISSACAAGGGGSSLSGPITRLELDSVNAFMVDEAVQLLRPAWMPQLEGGCYAEQPMTMDELSSLPLVQIQEITRISASEAAARCGIGGTDMMASGYYLLITRRR